MSNSERSDYRESFLDFDDMLTETMATMGAEHNVATVTGGGPPVARRVLGPVLRPPSVPAYHWTSVPVTEETQRLANAIHDNSVARRRMARRAA